MTAIYTTFALLNARFSAGQVRSAATPKGQTGPGGGAPDEDTVINPAIERSQAVIHEILEPIGYSVPFTMPQVQITDICEKLTMCDLHASSNGGVMPEAWQALYDKQVARLNAIAAGTTSLEDVEAPDGVGTITNTSDGRERVWQEYQRDSSGEIINPAPPRRKLEDIL